MGLKLRQLSEEEGLPSCMSLSPEEGPPWAQTVASEEGAAASATH